jgi:hypothetical protein
MYDRVCQEFILIICTKSDKIICVTFKPFEVNNILKFAWAVAKFLSSLKSKLSNEVKLA